MDATELNDDQVNIGSGNGSVPEPTSTQVHVAIWRQKAPGSKQFKFEIDGLYMYPQCVLNSFSHIRWGSELNYDNLHGELQSTVINKTKNTVKYDKVRQYQKWI